MMHIVYSPYFPEIVNFPYLLSIYFFASHHFDHDALTPHALHVLDAPVYIVNVLRDGPPA